MFQAKFAVPMVYNFFLFYLFYFSVIFGEFFYVEIYIGEDNVLPFSATEKYKSYIGKKMYHWIGKY
jgi:hypothetical protein